MPFTLAHPAAILFLNNKYFNFLALILGSMSPDFIYFLLFKPSSNLGHTLIGFLFLNLQLCFLFNFLFEYFIKEAFIMNLPNELSKQYRYLIKNTSNFLSIKYILIFTYSSLAGMFTHVAWDSFTHKTGFFVQKSNLLQYEINLFTLKIPTYKILQHGSSIIGIILMALYMYNLRKKSYFTNLNLNLNFKLKLRYYVILVISIIITTLISFLYFLCTYRNIPIGTLIISPVNGLFLGFLFGGIDYKVYKNNKI